MPRQRYTNDDLIAILRDAKRLLGRTPSIRDFDERGVPGLERTPGSYTYKARFGSWSAALRKAFGEHDAHRQSYGLADDEKMRADLVALAMKLGRRPTAVEISNEPNAHHANTYIRHYGSWRRACDAILVTPF